MDRSSNAPGGFTKDLKRLKEESSLSAVEIREFLAQMRGKSTAEVLGVVAQSQLTRSMVVATLATVIVLVVGTVVPYFWFGAKPAQAAAKPAAAAAAAETPEENTSAATAAPVAAEAAPQSNADKALEKMDMKEVKAAPLDKNPLEDNLDNLLEGAE